jgi:hypothetical protein
MTTTRKATNCLDCGRKLTSSNRAEGDAGIDMCTKCYDYAGWENTHSDWGHDDLDADDPEREGCPVCAGEAPINDQKVGHTNTAPKSWSSHAHCTHPRTPKDRAACRKARASH